MLLYFLDPFEINNSIWEKAKDFYKSKDDPLKRVETAIGVPTEAVLYDEDFKVEVFVSGLDRPTAMNFIGDDILILEKNYGKVRLVRDGKLQEKPILDVEVNNNIERGMLGITSNDSTVYLYFTQSEIDGGESQGNHIYKYIWDGEVLKDPELIHVLPGKSQIHNGGAMIADKEGKIYAVIGDQNPNEDIEKYSILQNHPPVKADDTGIILLVESDGSVLKPSTTSNPFDYYYAIGIRNSYGLEIDPLTGHLWDTENGADKVDEINLVEPKFNSGWFITMGPASDEQISNLPSVEDYTYSDPEFSWEATVAPTALKFANSVQFQKYKNDLFVGTCNEGYLFKFTLNAERTGFVFNDSNLEDLVVNVSPSSEGYKNLESMKDILFGSNFGCVTDIEFGPDGNLYVTSITSGAIYKISPK